jgi:hypothetical protein
MRGLRPAHLQPLGKEMAGSSPAMTFFPTRFLACTDVQSIDDSSDFTEHVFNSSRPDYQAGVLADLVLRSG